jgi:hypothetical protein
MLPTSLIQGRSPSARLLGAMGRHVTPPSVVVWSTSGHGCDEEQLAVSNDQPWRASAKAMLETVRYGGTGGIGERVGDGSSAGVDGGTARAGSVA